MKRIRVARRLKESTLLELVGKNEKLDQNKYSGSVSFDLSPIPTSGELLSATFVALEEGTGAVQDSAGKLLVFDADPGVTLNDAILTAAAREMVVAELSVTASDWSTDASGGSVSAGFDPPAPFHKVTTLYVVWEHLDATGINDTAADDETLQVNIWSESSGEGE